MGVHKIGDEKKHGRTARLEVYWFELDLADRAGETPRNRAQPGIQIWGGFECNRGLRTQTPSMSVSGCFANLTVFILVGATER